MADKTVEIPVLNGSGTFNGFLALPAGGAGPGILLIQEIFGVNEHIRSVARQYALDGYVVFAPDLFWRLEPGVQLGYEGADRDHAVSLMQKMDFGKAVEDLRSAVETLRARPECQGTVTSVGFCMGGLLSYFCGVEGFVDASVCYYPGGIANHLDKADRLEVPIILHFAGQDHHISIDQVQQTRDAFSGREDVSVFLYEGVEHGFNCWARGSYDQHASALAHGRSLTFIEGVGKSE